jgi:hypothetical protein
MTAMIAARLPLVEEIVSGRHTTLLRLGPISPDLSAGRRLGAFFGAHTGTIPADEIVKPFAFAVQVIPLCSEWHRNGPMPLLWP